MEATQYKVFVVGLDGATFDLMLPWIEEGRLPCLAKLLESGAHSPLQSTTPPITPCAWSSFMTGKNPGKHGLFDFVEPDPNDNKKFRFTNANCRSGETLWGMLSRNDHRVGIVNVPMTYPPEEVNGFMISGLDTPHEHSPFMYPAEVRQDLKGQGIRYKIDLQHLGNMRTDKRRQATLDEIFEGEESRTSAMLHLSESAPCDFRMIVYGATDQVQHHFWHYMDPEHDKYDASGAEKFKWAIRDTYEMVDREMARLMEDCDENTIVVVMSDHGFGPMTNVRLRINQALEEAGLLKFEQERPTSRWRRLLAGIVDGVLRSTLSSGMKRTLAGMFPKLRVWFEKLDNANVDWQRTSAYVNEAYRSSPAIWLNEMMGDAEVDDAEKQKLIEQIEEMLAKLKDPATGEAAISQVVHTEEIYEGPHKHKAPELLLSWWLDGFLLDQSEPGAPKNHVVRCEEPIQGGVEFAASHRLDGVFMIAGGPVKPGFRFEDADIIDVAPTILHLMGQPVPDDMDGRVLTECLDPEFLKKHPVQSVQSDGAHDEGGQDFTDDESEMIRKRLQALGYIQ